MGPEQALSPAPSHDDEADVLLFDLQSDLAPWFSSAHSAFDGGVVDPRPERFQLGLSLAELLAIAAIDIQLYPR